MKNILTIAKRELWYYFNTPTAYIIIVAFLIPINFLFWRTVMVSGEASLRGFFSILPWFMLLVIPALTMRVLSEEQRKHTLELLLSHAVSEWQIVLGKFLGVWIFYALILVVTLTLPATLLLRSLPGGNLN
jgi:ABC-2 type transport system permease protein